MKRISILLLPIAVLVTGCPYGGGYKYNTGTLPVDPVNLSGINSEYDDYNLSSPVLGEGLPLVFSSNRESLGNNFDFVYKFMDIAFYKSSGELYIGEESGGPWQERANGCANITSAFDLVNTQYNELGPFLIPQGDHVMRNGTGWIPFQHFILMYATDESGNLDIKLTHNLTNETYIAPVNVSFLNSLSNDAYPFIDQDSSLVYFCSDRGGDFDIYKSGLPYGESFIGKLTSTSGTAVTKITELSSAGFNDKCPFIVNDLMVFASDRPGGYGGYDLYYSRLVNGTWQNPVNMGAKINTANDEFRPIIRKLIPEFTNDFMLFSSNRPGGKGGFDLYYVGINL